MSAIPIALQLYTVRGETERDFAGTLAKVARIGYTGVEFAGYGGLTAAELKTLLDDLGLKAAGGHVGLHEFENDLNAVLDYHSSIGNTIIAIPYLDESLRKDAASWKNLAIKFTDIGRKCAERGITLCYHNHDFEFKNYDGVFGFDLLYGNSDPQFLQAELDLYWIKKGGQDPAEYVRKFAGRAPLLHIKDMDTQGDFAEFGEGIIDWDPIFAIADHSGTKWYIVEQDECKRPCMESIEISFRNLQKRGMA